MDCSRKVILFSAMSLDGFIAKNNGDIDWLDHVPNKDETDHGYRKFYQTIDTTIIGRKTYEQILSFDSEFPYPDKKNYVFSHKVRKSTNYVEFISDDIVNFINELKTKPGKDIWIVGGGQINSKLLENNIIDILHLQIFPIILNQGIPLSNCNLDEIKFKLIKTEVFPTGVIGVLYEKENDI